MHALSIMELKGSIGNCHFYQLRRLVIMQCLSDDEDGYVEVPDDAIERLRGFEKRGYDCFVRLENFAEGGFGSWVKEILLSEMDKGTDGSEFETVHLDMTDYDGEGIAIHQDQFCPGFAETDDWELAPA